MRRILPRSLYLSLVLMLIGLCAGQGVHLEPCCDSHAHADEAHAPQQEHEEEPSAGWDCFCHVAFVPQPYPDRPLTGETALSPLIPHPPDALRAGWTSIPDQPPRG